MRMIPTHFVPGAGLLGDGGATRGPTVPILGLGLLAFGAAGVILGSSLRTKTKSALFTPAPRRLDGEEARALPYPLDALPGGRDVATPYGSIRVYEWGPEDGPRVLFVHGISTPTVSLGDLAHEMVAKGCRVMLFDLFGRGYSDAPNDLTYDARLYVTQILLVLASSADVCWTAAPGFHLVGYSLGGGLCIVFARYFPRLLRSLVLVAPCGLIRPRHVSWRAWLYYTSGLLPKFAVRWLVRRRIRPQLVTLAGANSRGTTTTDILAAEDEQKQVSGDGDANGGKGFNSAAISKYRPGVTVSSVVQWQVDHHRGFLLAFLSTIRNAPIYAPQEDWEALSSILKAKRIEIEEGKSNSGLNRGKILIVLGEDDPVIVKDETIEDAKAVLGHDGVEFTVLDGGHELPITRSSDVANSVEDYWRR
ncbi:alpha/beta-hydrolase [Biscogniauxia marginata]|nr:alpha/beta-hydrolase [Biscogniauxia marginata]